MPARRTSSSARARPWCSSRRPTRGPVTWELPRGSCCRCSWARRGTPRWPTRPTETGRRPTARALLHYRAGGFYCARAAQLGGTDPIRDVLRGVVASAKEPIAGGRHKVFGHSDLHIIPTTSTVASHLPRAVGVAYALGRGRRLGPPANGHGWPADAVVVCSFGDASVNHAAATAAFNTAGWCDHVGLKLPLLFVCEDNGLGISVRSPEGWVAAALSSRPGLRYYAADGCDAAATHDRAAEAAAWVRR